MSEIITTIFSGFTNVITSMTSGIQTAFSHILWAPADVEGVTTYVQANGLSDVCQFGLIFMGVSMAIGVGTMIFRMIKR